MNSCNPKSLTFISLLYKTHSSWKCSHVTDPQGNNSSWHTNHQQALWIPLLVNCELRRWTTSEFYFLLFL